MHDEKIEDSIAKHGNNKKQAIAVPVLDYGEYRKDWVELELTPEQENELLSILWDIMRIACDLSLDMDSVSMAIPAILHSAVECETDTQKQQEE